MVIKRYSILQTIPEIQYLHIQKIQIKDWFGNRDKYLHMYVWNPDFAELAELSLVYCDFSMSASKDKTPKFSAKCILRKRAK